MQLVGIPGNNPDAIIGPRKHFLNDGKIPFRMNFNQKIGSMLADHGLCPLQHFDFSSLGIDHHHRRRAMRLAKPIQRDGPASHRSF